MCPLYPFHIVLLYLCLMLPLFLAVVEASEEISEAFFIPKEIDKLQEENRTKARLVCDGCRWPEKDERFYLIPDDPGIASLSPPPNQEMQLVLTTEELEKHDGGWSFPFNVTANFLGFTKIRARKSSPEGEEMSEPLKVSVVKKKTIQSQVFIGSVAVLVSVAYINMGCAMDLSVVRETIRRPFGPAIGFVCQFLLMPVIAFCLGFAFHDNAPLRLGLFVTGVSPGGGASNIWTLMFGGNLNLSITMTAVSTLAAFFMMPAWLFSLGRVIFTEGDIVIPYHKILMTATCMVVPLGIGLLISRYLPKVSKFLVRILKPLALFIILFILIFGVWSQLYMFKIMDWKVILTGMGLPWLGFAFGCSMARLCGRNVEDVTAIAIETGVQNTGMSIFLLFFTFDRPLGDLAAVVPVAAATMTPIPLLTALCIQKVRAWLGYRTEGRCPVNVMSNEQEGKEMMDVKQSESHQKLMKAQQQETSSEEGDDGPIVKNGCPHAMLAAA